MDGDAREAAIRDLNEEVLRRRAESLAVEQVEAADEHRESILLFSMGQEWYGVRIAQVREIHNEYTITPVPCVPEYIAGVINIRGEIVSVTDLRSMMGFGRAEVAGTGDAQSPVIVVADGAVCTALLVEAIGDIVEIDSDAIEPSLSVGDKSASEYVSGQFFTQGRLVALTNIPKVLTPLGGE